MKSRSLRREKGCLHANNTTPINGATVRTGWCISFTSFKFSANQPRKATLTSTSLFLAGSGSFAMFLHSAKKNTNYTTYQITSNTQNGCHSPSHDRKLSIPFKRGWLLARGLLDNILNIFKDVDHFLCVKRRCGSNSRINFSILSSLSVFTATSDVAMETHCNIQSSLAIDNINSSQ